MMDDTSNQFESHRRYLVSLAYRMMGSIVESEDVVQDAYLRWHDADQQRIRHPRAYLSTVVTRLCLDRLRESRRSRESYVGPWLPEPLAQEMSDSDGSSAELVEDISFALMLALERLSPLERAAFLLHDVFDLDFDQVALTLDRSPAACRQLASRARAHVRSERPRFTVSPEHRDRIAEAFFGAARSGDTEALRALLADSATFHSDGGGRRSAARKPIVGRERVARVLWGIARRVAWAGPVWSESLSINGMPGTLSVERDGTLQTTAIEIVGDAVSGIYVVRNPDKLSHLISRVPEELRTSVASETNAH